MMTGIAIIPLVDEERFKHSLMILVEVLKRQGSHCIHLPHSLQQVDLANIRAGAEVLGVSVRQVQEQHVQLIDEGLGDIGSLHCEPPLARLNVATLHGEHDSLLNLISQLFLLPSHLYPMFTPTKESNPQKSFTFIVINLPDNSMRVRELCNHLHGVSLDVPILLDNILYLRHLPHHLSLGLATLWRQASSPGMEPELSKYCPRPGRMVGEWSVDGQRSLIVRALLSPGCCSDSSEMTSGITIALRDDVVASSDAETSVFMRWSGCEVENMRELLDALVVTLKWKMAAWLSGLEQWNYLETVQLQLPIILIQICPILQLKVAESILHELVNYLRRNILLKILVIIVPAELVGQRPHFIVEIVRGELSGKEISVSHVGQLRHVSIVNVGGSLATEVCIPQVFAKIVFSLSREPLEPVETNMVSVGLHWAVESKGAQIGLIRDDRGLHVEIIGSPYL